MPPWWMQPNKPEEPKEEPVPEGTEQVEPVKLSKDAERVAWRLLMLLDALRARRPSDPVSLDEIDQLGRVAKGNHDLHDACAALRNGCALDHLVSIFT